jgi:hypothetical protein
LHCSAAFFAWRASTMRRPVSAFGAFAPLASWLARCLRTELIKEPLASRRTLVPAQQNASDFALAEKLIDGGFAQPEKPPKIVDIAILELGIRGSGACVA